MAKITKEPASPFGWDFINDVSAVTKDENAIIEFLLHRLGRGQIYTWVGPVLLALNPGKNILRDLYDEANKKEFTGDEKFVLQKQNPHIYAVATRAQYRLVHGLGKVCQVIVISGESGTGKTFNARKALDFLADTNESSSGSSINRQGPCQIVNKIGNVFPLLSAFSTASTARNARSSRHGQLLRLQYDKKGVIKGACIDSFLLERTRVTAGSNNFEIFYQLIVGLSDDEIDEFSLTRDGKYSILGEHVSRDSRCFLEGFHDTVRAFEALGFTEECKINIFRIIALLMHMGNIRFKQKLGEGCTIDLRDEESRRALKNACSLISLREEEITELLTSTLICPQSSGRRHTTYRRDLKTPEDCRNRLFSIIRYLYDRLFHWLVGRVNESLSANGEHCDWLGILDIFGFESFETNGLEQLCINYSTERLQLYFMEDYLEAGQRELQEEGLDDLPPSLTIQIYRERLSVIEGIVFSTFNDACQSPLPPSLSALHDEFLLKQKDVSKFLKIKNDVFVIEHYSCSVEYTVDNLLSKNTDKVPTELSAAFGQCENKLLSLLSEVEEENVYRSGYRVSLKKCTALAKLKRSLDCLVEELNKCDSHYVRCTRPRHINGSWENSEFREQLAYIGIFDALPLARCKFPIRFLYDEFYKRYSINQRESGVDFFRYLSSVINIDDLSSSIHLGKRLVFFTEAVFFELEHFRRGHRTRCAEKIQSFWMKNRHKRGTRVKKPLNLVIEDEKPVRKTCEVSIVVTRSSQSCSDPYDDVFADKFELAQQDQENNNVSRESEDFNEQKNDWKTIAQVPSADTGYCTVIMGDKSVFGKGTSQLRSDFSKSASREELRIDEEIVESTLHPSEVVDYPALVKPACEIEVWKKTYVRNWLESTPSDADENASLNFIGARHKRMSINSNFDGKYPQCIELPRDSTLIVDLNGCPFFYRNRILSRRRPVEIPIRFHTRLTCLPNSHRLPRSLRPRGLQDCLFEKIDCVGCYN